MKNAFSKAVGAIILAIVAVVAWFAATRRRRVEMVLDSDLKRRAAGLDRESMDENFAHQVTPADPVQTFRDKGAV